MSMYEELGEVVDHLRDSLEKAPALLDQGQTLMERGLDLMKEGSSLMKRGAELMDRTTESLDRVDALVASVTTLADRSAENALLEKRRLELEIERLASERGADT